MTYFEDMQSCALRHLVLVDYSCHMDVRISLLFIILYQISFVAVGDCGVRRMLEDVRPTRFQTVFLNAENSAGLRSCLRTPATPENGSAAHCAHT